MGHPRLLPKQHLVVDGVHIVTRRGLKKMLTAPNGAVDLGAAVRVAAYLEQTLRPAVNT